MRIIDADDIVYESIDSTDTLREERYFGTGILAVRKEDIEAMPTIELPERKKANWEKDEHYGEDAYVCTYCETIWKTGQIKNMHFCPTCGTDMRGEQDG